MGYESGTELHSFKSTSYYNVAVPSEFSPDGKLVTSTSGYKKANIWDVKSGKLLRSYKIKAGLGSVIRFSTDGKYVVTTSQNDAMVWEVTSGKLVHTLQGHSDLGYRLRTAHFSRDSKQIVTSSQDNTARIWDVTSGKTVKEISNVGKIVDVHTSFAKILSLRNSKIVLYDLERSVEILSWISVDSADWVVTTPNGLFDASPGAMEKLYFVQGLDVIDFQQLKERYYEPGLWKKAISGEDLRNVTAYKSIDLPPDVEVSPVDNGYLAVKLINRGGGIGHVNVFINGKEVIEDAREKGTDSTASVVSLRLYVGNHKNIMKGKENFIGVKAWNADHWVVSKGTLITYDSKDAEKYSPAIHILACGVSNYIGNEIDLKYAAKDAEDITQAIQLGAKQLFGVDKSYAYTLTTDRAKEFYPTKVNILKALETISANAHPLDIFVMYVSGHGINSGGPDGDWHYLTQDAYTGNSTAYSDPEIKKRTTLSSNELVELFKIIPALKQVLIIDACASGKVVENLMIQKDISSSTLRALDRMRDRTGTHIITGCASDAVSYEASKYGQGILTYSILEGIRGAALREEKYIDINSLFQYAQDRVPVLADGVGGIQAPQVFSPQGSQSFDIGLLTDQEKRLIPIAKIRPIYIRSNFQDETYLEDVLEIGKIMDETLNEVSAKGFDPKFIFVDVKEYPDGCRLIGRYQSDNGKITLKLRKKCGEEIINYQIKANSTEQLKEEIMKVL